MLSGPLPPIGIPSMAERATVTMVRSGTPAERFAAHVVPEADGCHMWAGTTNQWGYGRFYLYGRIYSAHRWVYEQTVGPIPDGLTLDHLCRNHSCVNPAHLEPVTLAENV